MKTYSIQDDIYLNKKSRIPLYAQISGAIREKIADGILRSGDKLPPERTLAESLGIHRNTVIQAYRQLVQDGYVVVSRDRPKGYFILNAPTEKGFNQKFFPLEKGILYDFERSDRRFFDIYWKSGEKDVISFAKLGAGRIEDPIPALSMKRACDRLFDSSENSYMDAFRRESQRLKNNICQLLAGQGISAKPENIQLTAETTQALSYLALVYLRANDCVLAEEPIIPATCNVLTNRGVRVVTIAMEDDGMDMDDLEYKIKANKPKFLYTMPNCHNPSGITMSLEKRRQLIDIAEKHNVPILEENYMQDFCTDDPILPSLYSLDRTKSVLYLYSFTLIVPYMLKVGYVLGPKEAIDTLGNAISVEEVTTGGPGEYFLNDYIESGAYSRHVEVMRSKALHWQEIVCDALDSIADTGISYIRPRGGLVVWITLPEGLRETDVHRRLEKRGVIAMPGRIFYPNRPPLRGHLRLCYGGLSEEQIRRGINTLGEVIRECATEIPGIGSRK